jgi:Tol biopolymer transport system component
VRATVLPPDKTTFGPAVVSPDGRRLAFMGWSEGRARLWVQSLDSLAAQPLSGTDDASFPFWSADGRFLGFFAGGKLKKIDAGGGPPQTLCDAPQGRGGTWNQDGVIVFAPDTNLPLHRVAAAGGASAPLGKLDESRQETTHRWPWFLPDGRHFLYLARSSSSENSAIYAGSLDGEAPKLLVNAESSIAYAPPGYLLFLREQTLMAQPFSASKQETTGDAFPVAESVRFNAGNWKAFFSVSDNGVLVYQMGSAAIGGRLHWYDRSGRQVGSVGSTAGYRDPSLSPDARRIGANMADPQSGNVDVWLYELGRDVQTRFTFDPGIDAGGVWSPDGSRLAFHSNRKGVWNLYLKPTSGAGTEEPLLELPGNKFVDDWSRDGHFLLYEHGDPSGKTRWDLWVLSMQGERKPYLVLQAPFSERGARFSPNRRWIAYHSDESGRDEVYVIPFQLNEKGEPLPSPAGKWQVSTGGGWHPRWRGDGKELYYLSADDKVMAVEIRETGTSLEVGVAKPLFQTRTLPGPGRRYDASPDGQRFLINVPEGEAELAPLTLVVNWTTELRK